MDAVHGYFQIPLDDASAELTTFLLPSGRYMYRRAPMGLNASSDEWCRRSDAAFAGHPDTMKIVDDGITGARDLAELEPCLRALLADCRTHGITLSRRKFAIGPKVKFAGHIISDEGVSPDPEKIAAISDFPTPGDVSAVRSFLGLANQLGSFLPDLSHATDPLRKLLQKGVAFVWTDAHACLLYTSPSPRD